jgi:hypothetical protein
LTCSPLHNYVPFFMKIVFRIFWSRLVERSLHVLLAVVVKVPKPSFTWQRLDGPFFGNELAEFIADGREAETRLRKSAPTKDEAQLKDVARVTLTA